MFNTWRGPLLAAALLAATALNSAVAQVVTVTAHQNSPGPTIPADFIGISSEWQDFVSSNIYTPSNTSLINLLKLLGPKGVWRIGGGSADNDPPLQVTQKIANEVGAFASAIGWNLIIDLNARASADVDAQQARIWSSGAPNQNIAFQVGNEPEYIFNRDGQAWANNFNATYNKVSNTNWAGPDTAGLSLIGWADLTIPTSAGMKYVTGHKYSWVNHGDLNLTPDRVTADAVLPNLPGTRLTEWGIVADGGLNGVTNTLVAATYYLKLAQSAITNGFTGLNPHNVLVPEQWGDGQPPRLAYYNQVEQLPNGEWGPAPMFYGMWLWSQLVGQQTIATTAPDLDSLASITATNGAGGNANILVVNGDTANQVVVRPRQTSSWSYANIYIVSGNSCTDPAPTLNGHKIGAGGVWSRTAKVITKGRSIAIPPCAAALIEMQSKRAP